MATKFMFLGLAVLCVGHVFVSADINQVKKEGLQRIGANVQALKKLINQTFEELPRREDNLKEITKHEREFGDGVLAKTHFELTRTAISAYKAASILESPGNVFKCIELREREGHQDMDKYFTEKFLKPGREIEDKGFQAQKNDVAFWSKEYSKAIKQYSDIYDKTVSEIQRTKDEAYVITLVNDFRKYTNEMADITTSINLSLRKTQIQVLQLLDKLVTDLRVYSKYAVDKTGELMRDCFRKSLSSYRFFNF